jgi:hypothetical protein
MNLKQYLELKFQTELTAPIDAFKYFFGHSINQINTLDADGDIPSHNFCTCRCGPHSVSIEKNVLTIAETILQWPEKVSTHCDVGGARGLLSSVLNQYGIDSHVIEGTNYGILNGAISAPMNKYAVYDFASYSLDDLNLHKYFDLTTAFEITEHIKRENLPAFYNNMALISKYHFCSVHWGGVENSQDPSTSHYNVKDTNWWCDFLSSYGDILNVAPASDYLEQFDESDLIMVKFH